MTNNIIDRIHRFNLGRNPKLLELKYKAMGSNVFTFYRGTCHLFYEDFPKDFALNAAPPVWICGDLHLENFGSYKGDNRLVYFDINDFDEACLAPCTWDVVRFITSVIVGSHALKVNESEALHLSNYFLDVLVYPGEQLALWINLYNAFTISTILERYPIESIRPRIFHKSLLPSLRDAARTYFCLLNSPHNVTVFEQNSLLSPIKNSRI
ncbi:MAG: DUF2252 family protein [Nostoc sp.]